MKIHLRKVIGANSYTLEQLQTLVVQIEACLNSRPLMPISEDPNDFLPLTPAHFLIGASLKSIPEPSLIEVNKNRLSLWQRVQKIYHVFWERWSREYVTELQVRSKWRVESNNIQPNTILLQPPA